MRPRHFHVTLGRGALKRRAAVLAVCVALSAASAGHAAPTTPPADSIATYVAEASERFAIPASWIRAVMRAESAGDVAAVSSKGAMGLMQIMPKTWETLRVRYGLGDDPYDPRDNILAGAGYLRELFDRFGSPGFLAAYNAGPGRYEDYLSSGGTLSGETRAYLAELAPAVGGGLAGSEEAVAADAPDWQSAPLFVVLKTRAPADAGMTERTPTEPPSDHPAPPVMVAALSPLEPPNGLFVRRSTAIPSRP